MLTARSLADRKQEAKIIQRIASLEEQIDSMRTNQAQKLYYGNILLDSTTTNGTITVGNITIDGAGTITVSDGTNNRILIGYQASGF